MSSSLEQTAPQPESQEPISDQAELSQSPPSQPDPDVTVQAQHESLDSQEAEVSPALETAVEEPTSEWPDPSGWDSIKDLDVDGLPEASRPHFSRLKELPAGKVSEWNTERAKVENALSELEDARSTFHKLIESLDQSGDTKVVADELERYKGGFGNMASENITLAQQLFRNEHPDYERYPEEVRRKFAEEMTDDSFYTRYRGKTIYDKMKEAWRFAVFRSGAKPAAVEKPSSQHPVAARARSPPTNPRSAQGLVADGRRASSMPTPNVEEMSFQDIMDMHDHLLKS